MADVTVRPATLEDIAEIIRIQRITWQTSYAQLLPDAAFADLASTAAEQAWRAAIAGDRAQVYLATEGQWCTGFCVAGKAPAEDTANADGVVPADADEVALISTLLVEPRWGRRGHGGRLLATAAAELRACGAARGLSWIPETDRASLSFYHAIGWREDGTVRVLDAAGQRFPEIRVTGTLDLPLRD